MHILNVGVTLWCGPEHCTVSRRLDQQKQEVSLVTQKRATWEFSPAAEFD